MSLSCGANCSTIFAKVRIKGSKDEDRDHFILSQDDGHNKFGDISSFSVFDGHGGERAATICERSFFPAFHKSFIDSTVQLLPKAAGYSTPLRDEDIVDALLVNAIHDGIEAVHEVSVKESETAGTTLCSLFLVPVDHQKHVHGMRQSDPWQPTQTDVAAAEMGVAADCGRSYKVLCANIGDSRCVMVGCSAEPIKASSRAASFERGNSANNLAAMAAEGKASSQAQPTLSISRSARSFASLSSHNLSALGSIWITQSTKVSESKAELQVIAPWKDSITPPTPNDGPKLSMADRLKRSLTAYSRSDEEGESPAVDINSSAHSAFPVIDEEMEEDLPAAGTTMQVCVRVVAMCEDHKPSNKRERFRVEKRLKIGQQVLPVPLKAFDQSDEDFVQLYCHRFFGKAAAAVSSSEKHSLQSIEGAAKLRRGEAFISPPPPLLEEPSDLHRVFSAVQDFIDSIGSQGRSELAKVDVNKIWPRFRNQVLIDFHSPIFGGNLKRPFLIRLYRATELLQFLLRDVSAGILESEGADEDTNGLRMVRAESCFKIRSGSDGTIGPEAFFPRFSNNSLLMTRSVGDKSGPRGCLARADITSVTVHSTQHARFVLASDGVWDVIDEELVRKMGLYYKYKDPRDFAVYLAEKALKRRTKLKLSKDDITVFVVDVNPDNAVFIKTPDSREDGFYPAYHKNAMKKWTPMKSSVFCSGPPANSPIPISTTNITDHISSNSRCLQS